MALQNVIHANHAKFAYGVFVSVDRIEVSNYLLDHRVLFGFFFPFSAKINDYVTSTSA